MVTGVPSVEASAGAADPGVVAVVGAVAAVGDVVMAVEVFSAAVHAERAIAAVETRATRGREFFIMS